MIAPFSLAIAWLAQVPGVSARNIAIDALHAIPMIPVASRAAAATIATLVPWSSSPSTPRLPATSREAVTIRPANSGLSLSIPVSMIAIVTPWPE